MPSFDFGPSQSAEQPWDLPTIKLNPSFFLFYSCGTRCANSIKRCRFLLSRHSRLLKFVYVESRFRFCGDWSNSDSSASGEPRGVLRAAFIFVRHGCKRLPVPPPPPPRAFYAL